MWGETYRDFMDALMPLACLTVQIAGRNRMWRKMLIDATAKSPAWAGGDYTVEPREALRTAATCCRSPAARLIPMQIDLPDARQRRPQGRRSPPTASLSTLDANDLLYQVSASRDYDPSARLAAIRAPVVWVNSADDFINPPELGIAEAQAKRLAHGRFVLLPISERTRGHGSHTWATLWKADLVALLDETAARPH